MAGLGETVSGGQPGGAGSDNQGVGRLYCATLISQRGGEQLKVKAGLQE